MSQVVAGGVRAGGNRGTAMPSLIQPRQLLCLGVSAASSMVLTQVLAIPDCVQEAKIRLLLHQVLPPMLLQDVLTCVLHLLAKHHPLRTSPSIISYLLRILAHPNINKLQLSDLSYAGTVELEALDKVEATLVQLLPSFPRLTHLDLSTHGQKVTLPSCSSGVLEAVGNCCPDLVQLNLNHNNRVTSEGLLHLYPGEQRVGCVKLEELFIQDCCAEPEDVAMLLYFFPALRFVGFRELGVSLQILKKQPRWFRGSRRRKWHQNKLLLTHVDNTLSKIQRCDGEIVDFLVESCPDVENLKIRVCDENVGQLNRLGHLKHLELRFYTGVHHPIGNTTVNYLAGPRGASLVSLTIFCHRLHSYHVATIAKNCPSLVRLYLYANMAVNDTPLASHVNNMQKLEVLSLRLGHDELTMSPTACDLLHFLVRGVHTLQELYLLVRCLGVTHNYIMALLALNSLPALKIFIADVPHRTLAAPMMELNLETAYLLIHTCPALHTLGNLICWDITPQEVAELQAMRRLCNFNLTIIYKHSNKINDKFTN
ncbi:hypothetical protein GWK47_013317 [Chionoecetes opilio]|uniref:Uncharacterized protein n=1 Tax=Chionoecetes opilio TaxID=41210 RepID=A0A8J5CKI4_CHIOP|nr:hypothetical protein GWK47_013317 [Chionoecetes opilio]